MSDLSVPQVAKGRYELNNCCLNDLKHYALKYFGQNKIAIRSKTSS